MVHGRTFHKSLLALTALTLLAQASRADTLGTRARGGTLELRTEANVVVGDVKLRQICRWSEDDADTFAPVADLVVARVNARGPFASVKLDDVRTVLQGAGVNTALIRFTGAAACTISRTDVAVDNTVAFDQWAKTKEASRAASQPAPESPAQRAAAAVPVATTNKTIAAATAPSDAGVRTLREQLLSELAVRLQLPLDTLQVTFDPRDDKILSLTNPPFRFQVLPRKVRNLGNVNWDVVVVTKAGDQKANIAAVARAWQTQLVAARPVNYKQIIRAEDVETRRVLIDALPDQASLAAAQVVGEQAAVDLKIGTVITANAVESVPLVRTGQLVTVTVCQGAVSIKTAARAVDSATYGQPVKLRNEATKDIFEAIVTGQQQATIGSSSAGG